MSLLLACALGDRAAGRGRAAAAARRDRRDRRPGRAAARPRFGAGSGRHPRAGDHRWPASRSACILLLLNVVALTSYAQQPWLKVGVRVLGSWSAASALLVLALALRR